MAVVIGRRCRHVRAAAAHEVIAGYMVCNDVSVRDWQLRSPTATLGKSFDTTGRRAVVALADEVENPEHLGLKTWVNGELRQNGNTSDFIYSLGQMLEELTTVLTLEPGDILTTGSPGRGCGGVPPALPEGWRCDSDRDRMPGSDRERCDRRADAVKLTRARPVSRRNADGARR